MIQKLQKIIDPNFPIDYPPLDNCFLLDVIKKCLERNPKKRPTIPELLEHAFLKPDLVMSRMIQTPMMTLESVKFIVDEILAKYDYDDETKMLLSKTTYEKLCERNKK